MKTLLKFLRSAVALLALCTVSAVHAQKISELSAGTSVDSADLVLFVDVSDTTGAASGTTKRVTFGNFKTSLSLQPLDSDLTAIAALTTSSFGRGFLDLADASAGRLKLGLGGAAILDVGTSSGTVAAGNHTHSGVYQPASGALDTFSSNGSAYYLSRGNHTGTQAASTITGLPVEIGIACSDETTAITTGTAKVTFRAPFAFTVTSVRSSLTTVSSSGNPTVDINEAGASILGTKLSIDQSEKTSATAASAATITDNAIADDAEITIDIDVAGTDATGLKVWILGTR